MKKHGAALAAVALGALTPNPANAYAVKKSAEGELVSWRAGRVVFSLDASVSEVAGANDAVATALAQWSGRGGAPTLKQATAADGVGRAPGVDGHNTVFFAKKGYAPAGNALAITVLSFDELTGEVLDADIVLNGKFAFGQLAHGKKDDAALETYDIARVVSHEMGHALGLSDEPANADAVMYPYVAPAQALPTKPESDDVAGLTTLYAEGPSAATPGVSSKTSSADHTVGCGAIVAPRGLTQVPTSVLVATALGVVALVLVRGGRRSRRASAGAFAAAAAVLVVPPVLSPAQHASSAPVIATHDPSHDDRDAVAVVTTSRTSDHSGLFRTELELSTTALGVARCAAVHRADVWGGTLGGIRQVVDGALVPRAGDRVAVAFEREATPNAFGVLAPPRARVVRAVTKIVTGAR